MTSAHFRDLSEFGLPFVTPENSAFPALVREIQSRPQPFGPPSAGALNTAAVLLNQSGKAIVALAYIWRYTTAGGQTRTSRYANLGSSTQLEVLAGRSRIVPDRASFILPGSKRLITPEGMFGDNSDVLPPELEPRGGGYIGTGGAGGARRGSDEEIAQTELQLDVVFLDDGLCVGPDEAGLFESVTDDLERHRNTAAEIVEALRQGASAGQVFEILRSLARHTAAKAAAGERVSASGQFLTMFANMAIHHLIHTDEPELLGWFERFAQRSPFRLHRPS